MKTAAITFVSLTTVLACAAALDACAASDTGRQVDVGAQTGAGAGASGSYPGAVAGWGAAGMGVSGTGVSGSGAAGVGTSGTGMAAGAGGAAGAAPAGSGGNGGSTAGAGAGAGSGGTAPTASAGLATSAGWVSAAGNSYAIQGAWYTFCDSCDAAKPIGTSSIDPSGDGPYALSSTICASGNAGQIEQIAGSDPPEYDWSGATWGAGIGLNLNQQEGDPAVNAYPNPQGIKGFQVKLSGSVDGGTIRVKYQVAGDEATDYCKEVSVPGTHSVMFTDSTASCWEAGGASPSPTSISAVQFQVVSNEVSTKSFDFCVDSVSPIP